MRSHPQAGASDSAGARTARAPRTTSSRPCGRAAARCTTAQSRARASGRRSRPTVFAAAESSYLDGDAAAGRGLCGAAGLDGPVEAALLLQDPAEVVAGRRIRLYREVLGRALRNHVAALVSAFGTEVDYPVRSLQHIEVVLDDDHRVAVLDEPVQHLQQSLDVGVMEPCGRLVQKVQRAARVATRQLGRQLHALRLTA